MNKRINAQNVATTTKHLQISSFDVTNAAWGTTTALNDTVSLPQRVAQLSWHWQHGAVLHSKD